MPSLTDRYVAVALHGLPDRRRPDLEGELRSSIHDAVEDRAAAGEDHRRAEVAVLEDLGDPRRLGARLPGRQAHLIGPELFAKYRQRLVSIMGIVAPVVGIAVAGIALSGGGLAGDAVIRGIGAAIGVAVQIALWVTLAFVVLEHVDVARDAKDELVGSAGPWTVAHLPEQNAGHVAAGATMNAALIVILTIGGLVFLRSAAWFEDESGRGVTILEPSLTAFLLPALIVVLVALLGTHLLVFRAGRWTMPLAGTHAVMQVLFAAPVAYLALDGTLVNPAFAAEIGWPPLAEGDGPTMVWLAVGVVLVAAWETFHAFRRARETQAQPRRV